MTGRLLLLAVTVTACATFPDSHTPRLHVELQGTPAAIDPTNHVVVITTRRDIEGLDAATGAVRWTYADPHTNEQPLGRATATSLLIDRTSTSFTTPTHDAVILDVRTGDVRAVFRTANAVGLIGNDAVIAAAGSTVERFDPGRQSASWTRTMPGCTVTSAGTADQVVAVATKCSAASSLQRLDPRSGRSVWTRRLATSDAFLTAYPGYVLVQRPATFEVVDDDGEVLASGAGIGARLVFAGDRIFLTYTEAGRLVAQRRDGRNFHARWTTALPASGTPLTAAGDIIVLSESADLPLTALYTVDGASGRVTDIHLTTASTPWPSLLQPTDLIGWTYRDTNEIGATTVFAQLDRIAGRAAASAAWIAPCVAARALAASLPALAGPYYQVVARARGHYAGPADNSCAVGTSTSDTQPTTLAVEWTSDTPAHAATVFAWLAAARGSLGGTTVPVADFDTTAGCHAAFLLDGSSIVRVEVCATDDKDPFNALVQR